MRRATLAALVFFLAFLTAASSQEKKQEPPAKTPPPPEFKIPPEDVARKNPVEATDSSINAGKNLYSSQCAMCHGADGDGKGDLAKEMELKLKDYRDPKALEGMTDGELFYIITKGKGDMVGEEGRFKPNQIWNLVNFIRSLAKKDAAPKPAP